MSHGHCNMYLYSDETDGAPCLFWALLPIEYPCSTSVAHWEDTHDLYRLLLQMPMPLGR